MDSESKPKPRVKRNLKPAEQQAEKIKEMYEDPEKGMALPPEMPEQWKAYAPPEMVKHVQGSTAAVGSGAFHMYKMMRHFESDRIQAMQLEADRIKAQAAFDAKRDAQAQLDEAKTSKNRAKREKKKKAQQRAKEASSAQPQEVESEAADDLPRKRRLVAPDSEGNEAPAPHSADA
ncbi:hypothetical protein MCAP1_000836 [Malassezia caprae]|uniref:PRKR-interacting protein 1 n=1 Tax=Malassezia caprae TaxID=1381934 RepID=A0AAF0E4U9_9BASI|nr:hypothetical protein MCAP1_000836 [Malassezia caprae]